MLDENTNKTCAMQRINYSDCLRWMWSSRGCSKRSLRVISCGVKEDDVCVIVLWVNNVNTLELGSNPCKRDTGRTRRRIIHDAGYTHLKASIFLLQLTLRWLVTQFDTPGYCRNTVQSSSTVGRVPKLLFISLRRQQNLHLIFVVVDIN